MTPIMVLLISGGIDSPVAGYLMGKQGVRLVAISGFVNPKGGDMHIKKISSIVKCLSKELGQEIPLYFFEHTRALSRFYGSASPRLTCVLCKRMMLRVAEKLCERTGGSAIIMGDSLGQVASQTLQNIGVIEQAASIPIVRPLIGLDKVEIVRIAEDIGTFEMSTRESPECIFVPPRPAIKAVLQDVLIEEDKLGIGKIAEDLFKTVQEMKIDQGNEE